MHNKKLAILGTRGIPARYGGFETFAEEISVRLAERGVDVTVYCAAGVGDKHSFYKGVGLVYLPSPNIGSLTTVMFDLFCLWHARKGYDIVYMLGYGTSMFCFIPRLWGTKVWINIDGVEWARAKWSGPAKAYFKIMETLAMWIPDRLIADAEGIRQFLHGRHKHMPACNVIPYGAPVIENLQSMDMLTEWNLQPYKYYLVVCRLEPENHLVEIVEGFTASKSTFPLIVVGDHQINTAYVHRLKNVSDRRIQFIGTVYDRNKLQSLRYYCKAYFHGHSVGGTNPSLLEALGCGNIVIAHDNLFNREVAGDLEMYFRGADEIPSLVAVVENMNEGQRSDLSTKARERINSRYNWDIVTGMYQKILKDDE